MKYVYDDGGRAEAGFRGKTRDCVCRAAAIVTGLPYDHLYDSMNQMCCSYKTGQAKVKRASAREGVPKKVTRQFLASLGFVWTPTMKVGSGCTTHLRATELPGGRLLVSVSGHITAVIDGIVHDTYDPSRARSRCVYGFWRKEEKDNNNAE